MAGGILGSIIGAAIPGVLPSVAETAKILVDRLVPDPAAREQAQRALEQVMLAREQVVIETIQKQNEQQAAINLQEAASPSFFVSGWRPAVSWICVFGFGYSFVLAPVIGWFAAILGTAIGVAFPVPPTLDSDSLMTLLLGLLGLGSLRTFELSKGVAPANMTAPLPKPSARR